MLTGRNFQKISQIYWLPAFTVTDLEIHIDPTNKHFCIQFQFKDGWRWQGLTKCYQSKWPFPMTIHMLVWYTIPRNQDHLKSKKKLTPTNLLEHAFRNRCIIHCQQLPQKNKVYVFWNHIIFKNMKKCQTNRHQAYWFRGS